MAKGILLALLLLLGSYEAGREWLKCLTIALPTEVRITPDIIYVCSVVALDFHHLAAVVLLVGSLGVLVSTWRAARSSN